MTTEQILTPMKLKGVTAAEQIKEIRELLGPSSIQYFKILDTFARSDGRPAKERMHAIGMILDRLYGKPEQAMEINGGPDQQSNSRIAALAAILGLAFPLTPPANSPSPTPDGTPAVPH